MVAERDGRVGVLLGQAVGDALGAGTEFGDPQEIARRWGVVRDFVPGSPFGFQPGEFTDDTQMVICVLAAYRGAGGAPEDLLQRCAREFGAWLASGPPDVGMLTSDAINGFGRHGSAAGFFAWQRGGYESAGNGGLMRASASVVAGATGERLRRDVVLLTALTHADPRSMLSCLAGAAAMEALLAGATVPEAWEAGLAAAADAPVLDLVRDTFGAVWADAVAPRLAPALSGTRAAVHRGLGGDPGSQGGYVLDTLQAAAHASTAGDYLDAVGAIATRGNDSDTAGAVAGAVLAAGGKPAPGALLSRLHCSHGWSRWRAPGSAADLAALVPA
jgi:ADP-ribosyl-[dinitrogen reductase] hydrolase